MFKLAVDSSCEQLIVSTQQGSKESPGHKTTIGIKSEDIGALIEKHFFEANLSLNDLQEIRIGTGPGGFTGLRGSIAFVKALAYGRDIHLIPFSLLDLIREQNESKHLNTIVAMDGKQNIAFISKTSLDNQPTLEVVDLNNMPQAFSAFSIDKPCQFICYGTWDQLILKSIKHYCQQRQWLIKIITKINSLESAFSLPGLTRYQGNNLFTLSPNYLRQSTAALKLKL